MKKLIFFGGMCCLTSLILIHLPLLANVPLIRVRRNQVRCEPPLGRIISKGDKRFEVGSLICKGDKLELLNGGSVEFLCFSSGKFLKLPSGTIPLDKCAESEQASFPCNPSNTDGCRIQKGGTEGSDEPTIISPYSTSTLNPRPEITWTPVKGATSYKVKVESYEFGWEKIVNQTRLAYPSDEKEFQPGSIYTIYVFAYKDGNAFSYDSTPVNLLSVVSQEEIAQNIKRIKELGLPPDETVLDIDAIYASENLLNETIEMLKSQTETATPSRNPTLYRVLGDRYLRAWLPNEAKRQYTKAFEVAKSSNNSKELQKAQEGLKMVKFYNQLPTRRNGAQ
ncbi:hypothetical protein [Nostoc sp. 'Peltigera membranacea cyanobiont' 232]|uniref:hypothetical protein n=1 Tax=Nostoc sp. 'Peltigera membranacea cyanobiont' 232 TaxID=2014531 RepID=UPI001CB8B28E|nr:hypothetical protein [Nostoc sp. 'Peltigera membranacea cyanobiont' 232]